MGLMKTPWGKQESGYWDLFYRKTKAHRGAGLSQKRSSLEPGSPDSPTKIVSSPSVSPKPTLIPDKA